jgi:uncharacterized membrane protein
VGDTGRSTAERGSLTELIAIGYRDKATAAVAMEEVGRNSKLLGISPDAVAVIVREEAGRFTAVTNAVEPAGPTYMMFWGLLFAHLFFVPFLGIGVGRNLRRLILGVERMGLPSDFETTVRDGLAPGTSTLFAMVESNADEVIRTLRNYPGTVWSASVPPGALATLHEALHGAAASG